jgi:hypothetical protein
VLPFEAAGDDPHPLRVEPQLRGFQSLRAASSKGGKGDDPVGPTMTGKRSAYPGDRQGPQPRAFSGDAPPAARWPAGAHPVHLVCQAASWVGSAVVEAAHLKEAP